MPVTEYERNQLFAWFDEQMGKERAATMMSLLPPVGWGDVATKRDLDLAFDRLDSKIDAVAERLDAKVERLDTKIDAVADRLDTKIDAVADRLDTKIDAVAERLDAKIERFAERLDTKIDAVADRLDAKFEGRFDIAMGTMATKDDVRDLQRNVVTWMLTAQATVVAAVGLLLVALR